MTNERRALTWKTTLEAAAFAIVASAFGLAACSGETGETWAETGSPLLYTGVTATASSAESSSHAASKAIDGRLDTRWSSAFSDPQWLTVDLGATKPVDRVVLNWQNSYGKDYQIRI